MLMEEEHKLSPQVTNMRKRLSRDQSSSDAEEGQKALQTAEDHNLSSNSDYEDSESDSETLCIGGMKFFRASSIP